MQEKILTNKKNGMAVLIVAILLMAASIAGCVIGGPLLDAENPIGAPIFAASVVILVLCWIPLCGLKVLKPQEALVLTLFGKYVGTIKGEGFYFVNPFCSSVNPAANTKLNQSGDVQTVQTITATVNGQAQVTPVVNKKISLKRNCRENDRNSIRYQKQHL